MTLEVAFSTTWIKIDYWKGAPASFKQMENLQTIYTLLRKLENYINQRNTVNESNHYTEVHQP